MKKVKLKLKFNELEAIHADLFNSVKIGKVLRHYEHRLQASTLTELYMKLAPKILFRSDKPVTITLTVPQACALVLHVNQFQRNATTYLDNIYLRIATEIDQQLA